MDSASLIPEGLSQDLVNNINRDPLSFLVGDSAAFLKNNWEKKPVHVKANADRKKVREECIKKIIWKADDYYTTTLNWVNVKCLSHS